MIVLRKCLTPVEGFLFLKALTDLLSIIRICLGKFYSCLVFYIYGIISCICYIPSSEFSAHREGLERRVMDVELQLKMTTQRAEAREQHYQQRIKQNDAKWDQKFVQAC